MSLLQPIIHYSLHFLAPGVLAYVFFRKQWKFAWAIMILTMVVDLDHLYACKHMFLLEGGFSWMPLSHLFDCKDIFVPDRCSIGFHPLHSWPAIIIYAIMLFSPKLRIVAVGLLFHMVTDYQDCFW